MFFSRHIFFLKAVIIRLLTSNPLMPDYFKIFFIISVSALSAENDMNKIDAGINRRNKIHYYTGCPQGRPCLGLGRVSFSS